MKSAPLPPQLPAPLPWRGSSSSNLTASENRSAQISFTTKEGDLVTLSTSNQIAAQMASRHTGSSVSFTASRLELDSFAITVQGDLNKEELQDIKEFMVKLGGIARDFFTGSYGQALSGASRLGPLGGSLSKLSAEFSHSASSSAQTQLTANHPLPELNQELNELAASQDRLYKDSIHSRWRQIVEFLKEQQLLPAPPAGAGEKRESPVERLLEQASAFTGKNPHLTPFLLPLTSQALDLALAQLPGPERTPGRRPEQLLAALSGYLNG